MTTTEQAQIRSPDQLFDMSGRVALVTGGGTHLGRGMAAAFVGAGAEVHIASRRAALCQQVAQDLSGDGRTVRGWGCDVTDPASVHSLVERVMVECGRLDVLVCNAGGASERGSFIQLPTESLRKSLDVSVVGTATCAQAAARHMIEAGSGSIILIGSIHAALGSDRRVYAPDYVGGAADYHIAKGAVVNMARALAMEWSMHGVRVNCLSPGYFPRASLPEHQAERYRLSTPLGMVGRPGDLAGAAVLLASDAGAFITGQNLIVDGGWSAR